jgi:probable rRNA maturation factor
MLETLKAVGVIHPTYEISLLFVDDDEMRRLNHEHRHHNRTTDVLSFPQFTSRDEIQPGPDGVVLLGDVVISLQTLHRRSRSRGENPNHEMVRLLAHGVLHLMGYDHMSPSMRREMRCLEERVVDTIST